MSVSQNMDGSHRVWIKRCLVVVLVALSLQMASVMISRERRGQDGVMDSQTVEAITTKTTTLVDRCQYDHQWLGLYKGGSHGAVFRTGVHCLEWQRQSSMLSENLTSGGLSGSEGPLYTTVVQRSAPTRAAADAPRSRTTFSIYQDLPMDYTCEHVKDESHRLQSCRKVRQLVDYMVSKQEDTKSPDLYIVPMDYLALRATESTNKSQAVTTVLDTMARGMRYLHFGGSDHVFLCLTEGCGEIMHEVLVRHRMGKDTRAMWVGAEKYLQDLRGQWPCPDRVLNAPEPLLRFIQSPTLRLEPGEPSLNTLSRGARALLRSAVRRVEGMNRWACSKAKWDLDLKPSELHERQGCEAVVRHKLCFTVLPKCASSTLKIFLQRMSGIPNWNDPTRPAHGGRNGLVTIFPPRHIKEYIGNFTDTSVIKIVVLRDPKERLVSAYLDRFVRRHLKILGFDTEVKSIPSFSKVINRLMLFLKNGTNHEVDHHFIPQSNWGSLRYVRYDFVATVSSLPDDLETILTSLGLWERYGASGWGANGTLSFAEHKGRNIVPDRLKTIDPTSKQLEKIHEIYAEDYHRFGFPMGNQ